MPLTEAQQSTINSFRNATKDEITTALNAALARTWSDLAIKDLRIEKNDNGAIYHHPNTQKPVIVLSKPKDSPTEIYTVFDEDKRIASQITAQTIALPDEGSEVPVVTTISDYTYPPKSMRRIGNPQPLCEERTYTVPDFSELSPTRARQKSEFTLPGRLHSTQDIRQEPDAAEAREALKPKKPGGRSGQRGRNIIARIRTSDDLADFDGDALDDDIRVHSR